MQELGSDDLAVVYYRRFLAEAPADAAQRADAADRIAALSRKLASPSAGSREPSADSREPNADSREPSADSREPTASPPLPRDAELQHHPIDAAPPGQPLDLTAVVPAASQLKLTLLFRAAGQAQFTATPMLPHGAELVARIPASRMAGPALQYFVEARDASGTLVARSGKSTVPHVIAVDASAPARFYPDVAEPVLTQRPPPAGGRDPEDPLAGAAAAPAAPAVQGDGILDVGSRSFAYAKWSTTALAGVSVGVGVALYVLARDHARSLEDDATGCGTPPCQRFDSFDRDIERTGKLEQTISNVALAGGVAIAAVAGYLWVRELTAPRSEPAPRNARRPRPTAPAAAWRIAPGSPELARWLHRRDRRGEVLMRQARDARRARAQAVRAGGGGGGGVGSRPVGMLAVPIVATDDAVPVRRRRAGLPRRLRLRRRPRWPRPCRSQSTASRSLSPTAPRRAMCLQLAAGARRDGARHMRAVPRSERCRPLRAPATFRRASPRHIR